jgi:hypothetical protein
VRKFLQYQALNDEDLTADEEKLVLSKLSEDLK